MQEQETRKTARQELRGVLNLKEVGDLDAEMRLKVAVARDCRVIYSQIVEVKPYQTEVPYHLVFHSEGPKPMGVRLVVGPGDVSDEQLRALDVQEQWVPAHAFRDGGARVDVAISPRLYGRWRVVCRRYTIRGRVVCRRIVWDPREHRFVVCDAPVRGAKVSAFDVDTFWWWCRRDEVGSDFTDLNGNFEISFTWCCWAWRPWLFKHWKLDPELVQRIQKLLEATPIPLPRPEPEPNLSVFQRVVEEMTIASGAGSQSLQMIAAAAQENFPQLGAQLVQILPSAPDLYARRVWPWWPFFDCKPDITFRVTQDCGSGEQEIYSESCAQTRWDIAPVLNGVTLVANENACCGPVCCDDHPDSDCLVFQGVGCGGYPLSTIE
ncbi:MAG: hypothetical protein AB7G75_28985 [Candidatus Binatia bacterium]